MEIVLASSSPRRHSLLTQVGIPFRVLPSEADETATGDPCHVVAANAEAKALWVSSRLTRGLVIGADTAVVLDNQVLGKPVNQRDAVRMLLALSGGWHTVLTGVVVVDAGSGRQKRAVESTRVRMRGFRKSEAVAYAATGEPMDKAGAYGIQGLGALLVQGLEGCYANVVGLPLTRLVEMLREMGYPGPLGPGEGKNEHLEGEGE